MNLPAFRRDVDELRQPFDVVVVGGGVHGACIVRLLAMQGLKVALVEREDFGSGASRNCAKLLHGGFRYVQHLDWKRIRESMRAQRTWSSAAPHLVRPLRCVIPAYGYGTRSTAALAAGMCAFHLIAWDRNRDLRNSVRLPSSGIMSRAALIQSWPQLDRADVTGAAWWYDAQMLDSTRLLLEFLVDARQRGAVIANHVDCIGLRRSGTQIRGIFAKDTLTGNELEIQARLTINAAGPWFEKILGSGLTTDRSGPLKWMRNINLVTRRIDSREDAFGVGSAQASDARIGRSRRLFFVSPWQDCSIIGTTHEPYTGDPDALEASAQDIAAFLGEVCDALPNVRLGQEEVRSVHVGLTPADEETEGRAKRSLVVDHELQGLTGVLTAVGIKYTTAPEVAKLVARIACRKLGRGEQSLGLSLPTLAAGTQSQGALQPDRGSRSGANPAAAWVERIYGSLHQEMISILPRGRLTAEEHVFRCRVAYGMRAEMVMTLADAVLRATDDAERGGLNQAGIDWCAEVLAAEYQWSSMRQEQEMADLLLKLGRMHSRPGKASSAPLAA